MLVLHRDDLRLLSPPLCIIKEEVNLLKKRSGGEFGERVSLAFLGWRTGLHGNGCALSRIVSGGSNAVTGAGRILLPPFTFNKGVRAARACIAYMQPDCGLTAFGVSDPPNNC